MKVSGCCWWGKLVSRCRSLCPSSPNSHVQLWSYLQTNTHTHTLTVRSFYIKRKTTKLKYCIPCSSLASSMELILCNWIVIRLHLAFVSALYFTQVLHTEQATTSNLSSANPNCLLKTSSWIRTQERSATTDGFDFTLHKKFAYSIQLYNYI